MKRRSLLLTWGLPAVGLAALFGGAVSIAASRPHRPPEEPPRPPAASPAAAGLTSATVFIGAVGLVEPPGEAIRIASHTGGIVEAMLVAVGDRVVADQPLFRVDTRRAREELAIRARALAVAEAEFASLEATIPPARASLAAADANLIAARAALGAAEADAADRRNRLRIAESVGDRRAISAEEVDTRRFALEQALARVAEAQAAIALAEARRVEAVARLALLTLDDDTEGPELRAARARIDRARGDLAQAELELELLTVRAPTDGTVLQVNLRVGEFAPSKDLETGLVVLGRSGPRHVRTQIDEVDIARFRPGARAWASPRGRADLRVPLELAYVEPFVVPKTVLAGRASELVDTRVLEVVFALPADAPIAIGQQVDVFIEAAERETGS
jgi:multidrug resistance efflux pump